MACLHPWPPQSSAEMHAHAKKKKKSSHTHAHKVKNRARESLVATVEASKHVLVGLSRESDLPPLPLIHKHWAFPDFFP